MSATSDSGSFHDDEVAAQRLAGFAPAGAAIRRFMPGHHREFFAGLGYLFVGVADLKGFPLATIVTAAPGFVSSPSPTTLCIAAAPADDDPASAGWREDADVALLGLDFANRRRNRANGVIARLDARGATIAVEQSFGNCPKYIQSRDMRFAERREAKIERLTALDAAARELIQCSDTAFVASRSRNGLARGGLDVSHRGGPPGFVAIAGDGLAIPDYPGNCYLNTLGNLLGDPRAGLLLLDFERGDVLQLQGRTEIDWSEGAGRRWRFEVECGFRRRAAFPFVGILIERAPEFMLRRKAAM